MNNIRMPLKIILAILPIILFHGIYAERIESIVLSEKKIYPLLNEPIDVVFVCHPKDKKTIDLAIDGIKKNGKNIGKIYVVSEYKLTDSAEWFDEAQFPFTKESVAIEIYKGNKEAALAYLHTPGSRIGWLFAQLLKLYAGLTIPNISSNVLIIDADTIFLNPVEFIDHKNNALYNPGTEYTPAYFDHAKKLLPGFIKVFPEYSGISHHLLIQKPILEDLFHIIQSVHNTEPWRAMCQLIDLYEVPRSAMADYEIYFNFAFARTNQVKLRPLKWDNMRFSLRTIALRKRQGYHYVSCHTWL